MEDIHIQSITGSHFLYLPSFSSSLPDTSKSSINTCEMDKCINSILSFSFVALNLNDYSVSLCVASTRLSKIVRKKLKNAKHLAIYKIIFLCIIILVLQPFIFSLAIQFVIVISLEISLHGNVLGTSNVLLGE